MKKSKLFAILCIVAIMIATTATIVSAASSKAYGDIYYGCTNNWNPIKDKAWSTITYNGDKPVSNYLYVSMRVQYQEGVNFYWESPIVDKGYDRSKSDVSRWRYSLMAIETTFKATSKGCPDFSTTVTAAND